MAARRYRNRVTIQRRESAGADGPYGDPVDRWVNVAANVPANVRALKGDELYLAQQTIPKATHEVRMRPRPEVSAGARLLAFGKPMNVAEPPRDVDGMDDEILFLAEGVN